MDSGGVWIASPTAAWATPIAAACRAGGWRVEEDGFVALVDAGDGAREGAVSQALRARDPLLPIVRVGGAGPVAPPYDDVLDWPAPPEAVVAAVALWAPARRAATLARLGAAFGEAEVAALLAGLLGELRAALNDPAPGGAHRIAGLAGTLGLADVALTWQRRAEGAGGAEAPARRAARRALRDLG